MPTFLSPPTVDLLKRLVPGSLKQSLAKAIRLWAILQSLYGDEASNIVPDKFAYKDWEKAFFSDSHRFGRDTVPTQHDPECACAQSVQHWLFEQDASADRATWCKAFCEAWNLNEAELLILLDKLDRLFAVTGRSLENDFETLVKAGCLQFQIKPDDTFYKNRYLKVDTLPAILSETTAENPFTTAAEFIHTDLSEFVDALAQPIQGVQRFFLHTEYVVPNRLSDDVSDYQVKLKECWNQPEISPVHLKYESAREYQEEFDWLVYPVCVFYYQRAPYLFAYGHQVDKAELQWYDFRLDHITALEVTNWQHPDLQVGLLAKRSNPPTPDDIHQEMNESWGFEFYRPSESLILRFDQYFYANYIAPTERALLFTAMTRDQVIAQTATLEPTKRTALQKALKQRSASDIYCKVEFRSGDRNITMRLRAWSPNVEVILPHTLREQMAQETMKMSQLYSDVTNPRST
jgi:CRISPR-associated protein (TIGR03985 family)